MAKTERQVQITLILYSLTVFFLAVLSFYAYSQIRNLIDSSAWVNHTNNVTLALQKISTAIADAETNQRGFLLSGEQSMLDRRDSAIKALHQEISTVGILTRDNPEQAARLKELRRSIKEKLESMNRLVLLSGHVKSDSLLKSAILSGADKMIKVRNNVHEMALAENQLLELRSVQYLQLSFITPLVIVVLFLGALLILLVSFFRLNASLKEARDLQHKFEEERNLAQTILNSSPDNIVVLDDQLRCLSVNLQAEKFLKRNGIEYIGRSVEDIFPGSESVSDLKKVLDGTEVHRNDFYSEPTGSHFETHHLPLKSDGKIIGAISLSRDISPTIRLNRELEKQNELLAKANKELESFAYISSHDLQEPLRKIQTFVSRISQTEKDNLSESAADLFNRIQLAAKRMQTLINDLLAFSRTTTEERTFVTVNLGKAVEEVMEDLREELSEREAVVEVGEMCDAVVIPFQFRQLLHNIIGNAIKFAKPSQPPHIWISSRIVKGTDVNEKIHGPALEYCHLQIRDDGIGFEQKHSERIFEVFQRLHTREYSAGTGIGLAIVKKIVENHGGTIRATGVPNEGATFDIYLPAG
jgi:signal transduction histidine kinase